MEISSIINFSGRRRGIKWEVKRYFRNGELPTVRYDYYGNRIHPGDPISAEHIILYCKGGKSKQGNLVLALEQANNARGKQDITEVNTVANARRYYNQFVGIKKPRFDGDEYIREGKETHAQLGIVLNTSDVAKRRIDRPVKVNHQKLFRKR